MPNIDCVNCGGDYLKCPCLPDEATCPYSPPRSDGPTWVSGCSDYRYPSLHDINLDIKAPFDYVINDDAVVCGGAKEKERLTRSEIVANMEKANRLHRHAQALADMEIEIVLDRPEPVIDLTSCLHTEKGKSWEDTKKELRDAIDTSTRLLLVRRSMKELSKMNPQATSLQRRFNAPSGPATAIHTEIHNYFKLMAEVQAHLYMEKYFEASPLTKIQFDYKMRELKHVERQLETRYAGSPTCNMSKPPAPVMVDV